MDLNSVPICSRKNVTTAAIGVAIVAAHLTNAASIAWSEPVDAFAVSSRSNIPSRTNGCNSASDTKLKRTRYSEKANGQKVRNSESSPRCRTQPYGPRRQLQISRRSPGTQTSTALPTEEEPTFQ